MGERMAGKVVLVSGGGSRGPGIGNGRASAILCAREGARVAVFDIDKDAAAETKRMIDDERGKAIVVTGDVSVEGDCERAVAETVDAFSRLDVLVNVVGIVGPPGNAPDLDIAEWEAAMRVNLTGHLNLLEAARKAGVERVVYTSTVGCIGVPHGAEGDDPKRPVVTSQDPGANPAEARRRPDGRRFR